MQKFDFKSFIMTIGLGLVLNSVFLFFTGNSYEDPFLPILGMLSIFMLVGAIVGIQSEDITILEPGLGSILVSLFLYILLPIMNLESLSAISESDWIIVMMNNIIMTFVGAWLGEKLHAGYLGQEMDFVYHKPTQIHIENGNETNNTATINTQSDNKSDGISWSWVIAGTVLGLILSMIIVNIFGLILNVSVLKLFIVTGIAFLLTGIAIGRLSPGVTILESGLAGFLVMTIDLNIFRVTHEEIPIMYLICVLVGAFALTYLGGFLGEKLQEKSGK